MDFILVPNQYALPPSRNERQWPPAPGDKTDNHPPPASAFICGSKSTTSMHPTRPPKTKPPLNADEFHPWHPTNPPLRPRRDDRHRTPPSRRHRQPSSDAATDPPGPP